MTGSKVEILCISSLWNHRIYKVIPTKLFLFIGLFVYCSIYKGISPSSYSVSLRVYKAKTAGNFKLMLFNESVNSGNIGFCQYSKVKVGIGHKLIENIIKCYPFLAYLREIDIKRIISVVYYNASDGPSIFVVYLKQRLSCRIHFKLGIAPIRKGCKSLLPLHLFGNLISPIKRIYNVFLISLGKSAVFLQIFFEEVFSAFLIHRNAEAHLVAV